MVTSTFYFCSPGNFPEMDEKEAPIDIKAAFDEKEDMTNENPEQQSSTPKKLRGKSIE